MSNGVTTMSELGRNRSANDANVANPWRVAINPDDCQTRIRQLVSHLWSSRPAYTMAND